MQFSPSSFYELAKRLLKDQAYNDESGWRTVINRCYYGVFLQIRENFRIKLTGIDLKLSKAFEAIYKQGKIHSVVKKMLKSINPKTGTFFAKMQKSRRKSDYDLYTAISRKEAEETVALASIILRNIRSDLVKMSNERVKCKLKEHITLARILSVFLFFFVFI